MSCFGSWKLPSSLTVFGQGDTRRSAAVSRFPKVTFWVAVTTVVISSGGCSRSRSIRYVKNVTTTLSTKATLATASIRVRFMTSPHAVQSEDGKLNSI